MRIGPGFVIYDSTLSLVWALATLGFALACSGAILAIAARRINPSLVDTVGCVAFAAGFLAWWDFVSGGSWWRVYPHRPVYEELLITVASYLPVREAPTARLLRWALLAMIWLGLVGASYEQAQFFGGFGRHGLLDGSMLGALVMPPLLAYAGRRPSQRAPVPSEQVRNAQGPG